MFDEAKAIAVGENFADDRADFEASDIFVLFFEHHNILVPIPEELPPSLYETFMKAFHHRLKRIRKTRIYSN